MQLPTPLHPPPLQPVNVEFASGAHRNSQGAEVSRRHEVAIRLRAFAHRWQRSPLDRHRRRRLPAGERHAVGQGCGRAARQRGQTLIELFVERDELVGGITLRRQYQLLIQGKK